MSVTSVAVMLSAAERAVPLIDIDGTVFVQLGLFLLLLAVLYPLLWKPYLAVREQRERGIDGARKEARSMDDRAAGIVANYEARLTEAKKRGAAERVRLRSEGLEHERKVVGEARAAAEREIGLARASAQTEEQAARRALAFELPALAQKILGRFVGGRP